jgi:hypothetical protein
MLVRDRDAQSTTGETTKNPQISRDNRDFTRILITDAHHRP